MGENPYEPPRAETGLRVSSRRFKEWLIDRAALVTCGCGCFTLVWVTAMITAYLLGLLP